MAQDAELSSVLERLVGAHAALVRGVARQRGLLESEVEEILQDVRIRLWRALPADAMAEVNTTYVYRCAMSAVMDHIRRRRNGRTVALDEVPERPVPTVVDERLDQADLARRLAQALEELNSTRRPVVRMYLAG